VTLKITVFWDITPFSPYKLIKVSAECAAVIFAQKFTNIPEEILPGCTVSHLRIWLPGK
jgi:hypothetical protein